MSMIEIKRMHATMDAMNERIKALETVIEELKKVAEPVEKKVDTMTVDLEEKIQASVKASVDATLEVTKTELKAFAKSLIPSNGRKKASSPTELSPVEEPAQE